MVRAPHHVPPVWNSIGRAVGGQRRFHPQSRGAVHLVVLVDHLPGGRADAVGGVREAPPQPR
eukprot:9305555-Lingulodinium_polyedra.AAC.1